MFSTLASRLSPVARIVVLPFALTACGAWPSLRITSPPDGTTVHPGEKLTVTVEASPGANVVGVLVGGTGPLGLGKADTDAPESRFTFQIPEHAPPNKYYLTATGTLAFPRRLINSKPIIIYVERADSPVSITVYPVVADFTMNEKRFLQVTGRYADGTEADLTESSRIRYVSSAPGVARVDPQGIVTPVAPGSGKIIITYANLKLEVPLLVREAGR